MEQLVTNYLASADSRIKEFTDRGIPFQNIPVGLVEEYSLTTAVPMFVGIHQIPRLLKNSSRRIASELARMSFPVARMIAAERT